jgi:hypothetical protein
MKSSSTQSWDTDDLGSLDLGDKRRADRVRCFVSSHVQRPGGSIPQVSENSAEAKAYYRLLSNEAVEPDAIRASLQQAAVERIDDEQLILVPQDTTTIDLSGLLATQGLGPLGGGDGTGGNGMFVHSAIAVTVDGVPLGLLHQQCWARTDQVGSKHQRKQRPMQEKESYRWLQTSRAVEAAIDDDIALIQIGDRESDIFELLAHKRRANSYLLLRAYQNRRIEGAEGLLWDEVAQMPPAASFDLMVHPGPHITVRKAHLQVRFSPVTIRPPISGVHDQSLQPVRVNAIEVRETDAPEGVEPICWRLLTDLPVQELDDVRRYVGYYEKRWLIERYHYVLKSGCRIEHSQLRTFERLERLLVLLSAAALRLLWITYSARANPDAPCTVAFSDAEWHVLYRDATHQEPPKRPPTLHQAVLWTAKLGGFLARKGDGEPGVKVLWRGMLALHYMVAGFLLASQTCG